MKVHVLLLLIWVTETLEGCTEWRECQCASEERNDERTAAPLSSWRTLPTLYTVVLDSFAFIGACVRKPLSGAQHREMPDMVS
ncbi:hypothetical protein JOB18_002666 [Solea senegalensis]|uniref:Secreted protein n=1 Tax=Solea senegalensis TaxID=28829 RepID=A0AAV6Q0K0_SOLSE|nr:hypothetical protein JOB18_002666 [Solea senegalensis]